MNDPGSPRPGVAKQGEALLHSQGMCTECWSYIFHRHTLGLFWWLNGKESACNAGNVSLIPGLGRSPGGGNGNPLQYSCLENPYGQRSLAGYSPLGCKDTTEHEICFSIWKRHILSQPIYCLKWEYGLFG